MLQKRPQSCSLNQGSSVSGECSSKHSKLLRQSDFERNYNVDLRNSLDNISILPGIFLSTVFFSHHSAFCSPKDLMVLSILL